jgi:hypothetical protein
MPDVYWLAARDVARSDPELFGAVHDRKGRDEQIATTRADIAKLFAQIAGSWSVAEVDICRRTGAVTFKLGGVPLHPVDDLPKRLTDWWRLNRSGPANPRRKAA